MMGMLSRFCLMCFKTLRPSFLGKPMSSSTSSNVPDDALTDQEKEWLHTAATAFGKHVQKLDRDWVNAGEEAIKAEIEEWYVPTEEEMTLWRAGAIDAWLNAKGSFDPATAERVLQEQGMDSFIAQLKEAGAL